MKLTTIQLNVSDGITTEERIEGVSHLLSKNCLPTSDLIILPELWSCGFFNYDEYASSAQTLDGPLVTMLSDSAKKLGCYIIGGSFVRKDGDKLFNTTVMVDRQGNLKGYYDKIHLFGFESQETKLLTPGNKVSVIDTEFGKIGMSTCYDLRFPEQYRLMAEMGASLFTVVSDWPLQRLEHWTLFNQVRALENQCYLVSCNCAGMHKGITHAGNSMAVDPFGKIISQADISDDILSYEIDLENVKKARESFPAFSDRIIL